MPHPPTQLVQVKQTVNRMEAAQLAAGILPPPKNNVAGPRINSANKQSIRSVLGGISSRGGGGGAKLSEPADELLGQHEGGDSSPSHVRWGGEASDVSREGAGDPEGVEVEGRGASGSSPSPSRAILKHKPEGSKAPAQEGLQRPQLVGGWPGGKQVVVGASSAESSGTAARAEGEMRELKGLVMSLAGKMDSLTQQLGRVQAQMGQQGQGQMQGAWAEVAGPTEEMPGVRPSTVA